MNRRTFLVAGILGSVVAGVRAGRAQLPADLLDAGQRLLEQNLDPAIVGALQRGDANAVDQVLRQLSDRLQGEYVLDLAALQDAARLALPLLRQDPRTKPYASWLKSRMDYFRVAEQLRERAPAPRPEPGKPPAAPINPTPQQERQAWQGEVTRRSAPSGAADWIARLKPSFRAAGAPPELAWLAEVESDFDPQARSPSGAAGMYQLMPTTARDLGLKLQPKDERYDAERSARAAGGYLRRLHTQFGDWPLALAAYNAGPGRVSEVLRQRRARSFDAIAPNLPAETQMYVPKFEAVLRKREGASLSALKLPATAASGKSGRH